ncbi:unnamed protein product [Ectocarpus sp. 6 AP-2014]
MATRLRARPARRRGSARYPWSLQPVSRIALGHHPLEFVRRKAWTSAPVRFGNGISAVTSLCLCDEASVGGPSLLISGDEDGGVSVQRVQTEREGGSEGSSPSPPGWLGTPERTRLHSSCVNTIKILPDQRGYVCAGDDGALSAVATFETCSEEDLRRATFALTGHSSFVTDCDTAESGHAILSSSTDGRMLLWDPVATNTPVASVSVGRPVNSACFSAGDPYALLCAPELGTNCTRGHGNDDLVQIWDLRSLRCFKDAIPAAVATAFGEDPPATTPHDASMQPPPPQSPQFWTTSTTRSSTARTPAHVPPWLSMVLGSSVPSPATPLLRRPAWTGDSNDAESVASSTRGSREQCSYETPSGKENDFPLRSSGGSTTSRISSASSSCSNSPWSGRRGGTEGASNPGFNPSPSSKDRGQQGPAGPTRQVLLPARDEPHARLSVSSLPASGCLHEGNGKTWIPGGLKTWQASRRRVRTAGARICAGEACVACSNSAAASACSVQVSSDGKGILVGSRNRTVTLFDTQSHEVVYRFGHPRLSRARPVLVESSPNGGVGGWGRGRGGTGSGDVFAGTMEGELRSWRVGSQFPNRVFKKASHHQGFEIYSVAISNSGCMFASSDSSGAVYVQSATSGRDAQDSSGADAKHSGGD